jgi:hypothetical protein
MLNILVVEDDASPGAAWRLNLVNDVLATFFAKSQSLHTLGSQRFGSERPLLAQKTRRASRPFFRHRGSTMSNSPRHGQPCRRGSEMQCWPLFGELNRLIN